MSNTARLSFSVAPIAAASIELAILGVSVEQPFGKIMYRLRRGTLMAEIGQIVVIGDRIHAVPKHDLTDLQLEHLVGAAEAAFFAPRSEALGWRHDTIDGVDRDTTWIETPADTIAASATASAVAMLAGPDPRTAKIA